MPTLDQIRVGHFARIETIGGAPALVQRFLEMGLLEGEEIEVLALAPLGDPIEIRCGDSRLSLRCREAANIQVSPRPAG